jgi:hypothetical protein
VVWLDASTKSVGCPTPDVGTETVSWNAMAMARVVWPRFGVWCVGVWGWGRASNEQEASRAHAPRSEGLSEPLFICAYAWFKENKQAIGNVIYWL